MKNCWIVLISCVLSMNAFAQVTGNIKPQSFEEKLSYSVGYDVTRSLTKMKVKLEKTWMVQGIIDALKDSLGNPMLTESEMALVFQELQKKNNQTQEQDKFDKAIPNRTKGQEYIAKEMAGNSKMKKNSSGLVYLEMKKGTGKRPTPESSVEVKYKGYLIDGVVFDQTETNTATFGVTQVIPGWTEGLQLMQEGATFKFIISAELAYGNNPPPGTSIEPGSTLVFEVELIKVK